MIGQLKDILWELFDWMTTTLHHGHPFPAPPPGIVTPQHTANPNLSTQPPQSAPKTAKEWSILQMVLIVLGFWFGMIALAGLGAWLCIITYERIYGPIIYADVEFERRHLSNTMSSITSKMLMEFLKQDNVTISINGTRVDDGSSYYLSHYSNITTSLTTVPAWRVFNRDNQPITIEFARYKLLYQSLLAVDILMNQSLVAIKSK